MSSPVPVLLLLLLFLPAGVVGWWGGPREPRAAVQQWSSDERPPHEGTERLRVCSKVESELSSPHSHHDECSARTTRAIQTHSRDSAGCHGWAADCRLGGLATRSSILVVERRGSTSDNTGGGEEEVEWSCRGVCLARCLSCCNRSLAPLLLSAMSSAAPLTPFSFVSVRDASPTPKVLPMRAVFCSSSAHVSSAAAVLSQPFTLCARYLCVRVCSACRSRALC